MSMNLDGFAQEVIPIQPSNETIAKAKGTSIACDDKIDLLDF